MKRIILGIIPIFIYIILNADGISLNQVSQPINKGTSSSYADSSNLPTITLFPGPIFITMRVGGTIGVFPNQQVWQGGPNMLYDALTPDGKLLLVTSPSSNSVYAFNTQNGKRQAIIPVGKAPKGIKITSDGKFAYTSNEASADISIIDLTTLKVVGSIKVEKMPHNVRFTKDSRLAYVTLQGGAGIGVIDTEKRKLIKIIPVSGITGPHNLDLSPDEKTLYVRDVVQNVAILDLKTETVKKIVTVGRGHGGIDVSPDGNWVATGAIGDNFISVINTHTLLVRNIKVGIGPHGVRFSKNNQWIYVAVTGDNVLAIIDAKTLTLKKKIPTAAFPFWIAVGGNP